MTLFKWDWAGHVCRIKIDGLNLSGSGCQKTGVVVEEGLENAGVVAYRYAFMRDWPEKATKATKEGMEGYEGDLCPAVG